MEKTNVLRILQREKVPCAMHTYDVADGQIDGVSVARKVGLDLDMVFKTLVAKGSDGGIYVFVIPVAAQLDLKKAAKAAGVKGVEMLRQSELLPKTGYVHGGCSPIGMKKKYPVWVHDSARTLERMAISAGKIGVQAELAPADLLRLTEGAWASLTADRGEG